MNARATALWSAAALTAVLVSTNPAYRFAVLVAAAAVIARRRRPEARLRPLVLAVLVAAAGATVLDLLLSHTGDHVLLRLPGSVPAFGGTVTLEALVYGLATGLGIGAAVLAVAPLSLVAAAHDLVDALPGPLERLGTVTAAALNLVPGISRSAQSVMDAQRTRGWRPRGPGSWTEVLVPVVLTCMEDSIQLAEAMEARGFGAGRRTRFAAGAWTGRDAAVTVAALAVLVGFVVGRVTGLVADWYPFPGLTAPSVSPPMAVLCLLLLAPVVPWPWRRSGA